jgi:hypothetical protein
MIAGHYHRMLRFAGPACLLTLLLATHASFGQAGGTSVTTVTVTGSVTQGWSATMNVNVTMNSPSEYCFIIGEDVDQPGYDSATITLGNVTNTSSLARSGAPTAGVAPGYYGPGTYSATASYTGYAGTDSGGDDCVVTGSSGSTSFTVAAPVGSQTTLTPSASSYVTGQPVQFQVIVMPPGGVVYPAPTGTETLYYQQTTLATAAVNAPITLSSAGIPAGTYTVTAAYSGDSNYLPSTGRSSVTILPAQPTTVSFFVSPNPLVAGDVVELQASVTPGLPQLVPTGTVTFIASGEVLGTASVQSNGSATLTRSSAGIAAGTYSVVAKYSGDADNLPATSSPLPVGVVAQSATTTAMTIGPSLPLVQGDTANVAVMVTQATGNTTPSGSVSLLVDGKAVSSLPLTGGAASLHISTNGLAAGTYAVSAEYTGSKMDEASTSSPQQVVLLATTATQLSASPNPVSQGSTTFLTAKVTETHGTAIPTGTVTYSYQGVALGTATLDSTGTASLPLGTGGLSKGSYALIASYSGDAGNNASVSSAVTVVVQ